MKDVISILREIEKNRKIPTMDEAELLLEAQGDILRYGSTSGVCPRCGKLLELRISSHSGGTSIYCSDYSCIILNTRGI